MKHVAVWTTDLRRPGAVRPRLQGTLDLGPASVCTRCGRQWVGVISEHGLNLSALLALGPEDCAAAARCWCGTCSPAR